MKATTTRTESDSLGTVHVALDALYGAQSVRATQNFYITGETTHPAMIKAMGNVKEACARANKDLHELDPATANVLIQAAQEMAAGAFDGSFITDRIQGGAGTSLNMNANEILANRANQLLGIDLGTYARVHPNDHANKAQSTNDIIPTSGKLATLYLAQELIDAMNLLAHAFEIKAKSFESIIKVGRTHLQDAVLISMGQVFGSYATSIRRDLKRLEHSLEEMLSINLGATAVGTGINSVVGYRESAVYHLNQITGFKFTGAEDLIDGTKNVDCFAYVHGTLKTFAISLSRLCNDLRMMASGPKTGYNEIILPSKQPGSSIMPGKVNPVIPEVVNQVCFQVIGNDMTVTLAAEAGQMELNVFEPILFYNLFQSLEILTRACDTLRINAIDGLEVNETRCMNYVEHSLAMATALVKDLGYAKVSDLTQKALDRDVSLKTIILEENIMDEKRLEKLLDPVSMIKPRMEEV